MCRVVTYLGAPVPLDVLLYRSESALVRQAYAPQMLSFMNLAGFGFAGWNGSSPRPELPFRYKNTMLPMYDRNLMQVSRKVEVECLVAHVRGENYFGAANPTVGRPNLHPFQYDGYRLALAHNGGLSRFREMRYDLVPHLKPEVARRIEGSTDSEWVYALLLSQLGGEATAQDVHAPETLADALEDVLAILREIREQRSIHEPSGLNLFVSDGRTLVVTRFTFDFGRLRGPIVEQQLHYHSLWLTAGHSYGHHDGEWRMQGHMDQADSLLVASEPLTSDISTWIEVPEYTLLTAHVAEDRLRLASRDIVA